MSLARRWLDSPLSESAEVGFPPVYFCARNYFRIRAQISMRAEHRDFESLQVSEEEINEFTIHKGDFLENLFTNDPVTFVYRGNRTCEENQEPVLQKRVCTEIDENLRTPENQISRCEFNLISGWFDSEAGAVYTKKYQEFVSVYLKPEKKN